VDHVVDDLDGGRRPFHEHAVLPRTRRRDRDVARRALSGEGRPVGGSAAWVIRINAEPARPCATPRKRHIVSVMRSFSWAWTALVVTAACGGDLLGATPDAGNVQPPPQIDASSPHDAGASEAFAPDAPAAQDASNADAPGPACGGSWTTVFESYVESTQNPTPVWVFDRRSDFLDFFRAMAVNFGFVDPATGVTCTEVPTCLYDPTMPRVSPQDVHHSNALDEFIGPDGRSYVWTYYPVMNKWFLAEATSEPQAYQTIVDYNAGCLPNCACDAG
jgi:hypothetical protein